MMQVCPHCNANISDDSSRCPSCGQELDVFLTIPPPRFGASHAPEVAKKEGPSSPASPPSRPSAPVAREPLPSHDTVTPPPPPKRKPRPPAPAPAPTPRPEPPSPKYAAPAPPPYVPPPVAPAPPYVPPHASPAAPQADAGNPGKLRGWLIKQLGGKTAETGPQPPVAPYAPAYQPPPGWVQPPSGHAPPLASSASYPPVAPPMPQSIPVPPAPASLPPEPEEEEGNHTVAFGADLAKFKMSSSLLTLQIFDRGGHWHDWTPVGAAGLKIGRTEKNARFPELNSMAVKHMRIGTDGSRIVIEDLGSINGVYLKLNRFYELKDGQRFRVGSQVIEFQKAEPLPPAEPLVSEDGEGFWSRNIDAAAFLVFIRMDGKPGLRLPITRPDVTILGREPRAGRPVDIALTNDEWASGQHAQIRRDGDRFLLEDLGSRNGTFIQISGQTEILAGDVMLVGRVLLRAVDPNRPPR